MHLFIFILILFLVKDGFCFFKTFKYHSDITNSDLWVGHEKSKDCNGVIFTKDFHNVYVKRFSAAQVLLPQHYGSIYITDGGYLEISTDLTDSCIKIADIPLHSYYNPKSWALDSPAIPSIERIPCVHDEVMFPYALNSPVIFDAKIDLKMRHLVMDDTVIDDAYKFRNFLLSGQWPITAYTEPEVYFTRKHCEDASGCVCHQWREQNEICGYIKNLNRKVKKERVDCLNAIQPPIGECSVELFCGGVIHIKPKLQFNLIKLERLLEDEYLMDDSVAVYASKVAPNEQTRLIQVVFAEDRYTGKSVKVAAEFFDKLTTGQMMDELQIFDVKMYASGEALPEEQTALAVIAMILGTLFAVVVVFTTIYVCYMGPLKDYNFSKRSVTKTFGGVRYKSKDEERLVYEGQSMAGSILSLDRAFDNPMYGQQTSASTSTGETTIIQEQKLLQENPMCKDDDLNKIENVDSEI